MTLAATEARLARYIAHPTVSDQPNAALIDEIAAELDDAGARVEVLHAPDGGKANLWATLGPDTSGGIVLSGHTDVVPVADQDWSSDPFVMAERDGLLFGRGSCDMKGFVAAAVELAQGLRGRTLQRPLHFAFTHDEEVGCLGAQALVAALRTRHTRPALAIVGEPTGMQIIEGHKGCCEYTVRFTGLEGHGSSPDKGVNAVIYALRYAEYLLQLAETLKTRAPADSLFDPPWTTVNIGGLHGGVMHNVIPGKAQLDWEMRPVQSGDLSFVKEALARHVADVLLPAMRAVHPDAAIETEVLGEVAGLEPMAVNAARDLVAALTGRNDCGTVPFGTEAGLFQELGMDVVVCGPGHIAQAHKPDEFVSRAQMADCAAMLQALGQRLIG